MQMQEKRKKSVPKQSRALRCDESSCRHTCACGRRQTVPDTSPSTPGAPAARHRRPRRAPPSMPAPPRGYVPPGCRHVGPGPLPARPRAPRERRRARFRRDGMLVCSEWGLPLPARGGRPRRRRSRACRGATGGFGLSPAHPARPV